MSFKLNRCLFEQFLPDKARELLVFDDEHFHPRKQFEGDFFEVVVTDVHELDPELLLEHELDVGVLGDEGEFLDLEVECDHDGVDHVVLLESSVLVHALQLAPLDCIEHLLDHEAVTQLLPVLGVAAADQLHVLLPHLDHHVRSLHHHLRVQRLQVLHECAEVQHQPPLRAASSSLRCPSYLQKWPSR